MGGAFLSSLGCAPPKKKLPGCKYQPTPLPAERVHSHEQGKLGTFPGVGPLWLALSLGSGGWGTVGQFQAELGVHLFQKNLTLGLNVPAADPRVTKGGQRGTQEGHPRVSPSPALFKYAEVDLEFGSLGNSIYMFHSFSQPQMDIPMKLPNMQTKLRNSISPCSRQFTRNFPNDYRHLLLSTYCFLTMVKMFIFSLQS